MRDEICKKSKVLWPKTLKKWFNVKNKAQDFHADDFSYGGSYEGWWSKLSDKERCNIKKSRKKESLSKRTMDSVWTKKIDPDLAQVKDVNNYRIFVATWNVGGKSPTKELNLLDWLHTSPAADIYVLGFQEIVPLNAGNVLGTEDNGPAKKWLALIREALNSLPGTHEGFQDPSHIEPDPLVELEQDSEKSTNRKLSSFFQGGPFKSLSQSMRLTKSDLKLPHPELGYRYSVCDRAMYGTRPSDFDQGLGSSDEENGPDDSPNFHQIPYSAFISTEEMDKHVENSKYCLVASKQMVGIYITIWVKSDLRDNVRNMKVSCVGRGLMGYLGNKGSISISISLHQTSFCFICSHLTSGQKEGDEIRRNCDVMEIMRKTRFPRARKAGDENSPQTILDHDRIIWLGDLNYRISLSYRSAKALVEMRNWRALLENDQLRIEYTQGRVFEGWNEGNIYFPPTYKYSNNSDEYAGYDMHPREKRRTPAWCDRILWYGNGLHQMSYVRGESRFSDHRPVYSVFLAEVESITRISFKKNISYSSRIEVEELLPFSRRYRSLDFNRLHYFD
ncbi:type I inositol polyphosphate 5-phosphatase 4-like [Rutidosis leptorrhynchoides]|uniref:type I inositol polyphosphate 5-phosphatase 4-like n=1 Tax=Rutidosis leptorrhynchoides TaxID=125765 RepID=UPI003A993943